MSQPTVNPDKKYHDVGILTIITYTCLAASQIDSLFISPFLAIRGRRKSDHALSRRPKAGLLFKFCTILTISCWSVGRYTGFLSVGVWSYQGRTFFRGGGVVSQTRYKLSKTKLSSVYPCSATIRSREYEDNRGVAQNRPHAIYCSKAYNYFAPCTAPQYSGAKRSLNKVPIRRVRYSNNF
jgi:hypothetical protein